jgi:hypothetical protein
VITPAANEISGWFEKFCISRYAQRSAENCIDLSVFLRLTDQKLKRIGFSSTAADDPCADQ